MADNVLPLRITFWPFVETVQFSAEWWRLGRVSATRREARVSTLRLACSRTLVLTFQYIQVSLIGTNAEQLSI